MHVFVTGAANGIGAAVVAKLVQQSYQVTAADLNTKALNARWEHEPNVTPQTLDVRSASGWQKAVGAAEQRSPIDALINVAGVLSAGHTGELDADRIALQLDVNVKGVILGADTVARAMKLRGSGHIINVGSTASLFATPGNTVYAASKFAVRGFTIAAAGDLEPHGIKVTLVGPSAVKTDMLEQQRGDKAAALTFAGGRALTVNEVADAIVDKAMVKKPLEMFIPSADELLGKLCASVPRLFLSQLDKTRRKGEQNFNSQEFL